MVAWLVILSVVLGVSVVLNLLAFGMIYEVKEIENHHRLREWGDDQISDLSYRIEMRLLALCRHFGIGFSKDYKVIKNRRKGG